MGKVKELRDPIGKQMRKITTSGLLFSLVHDKRCKSNTLLGVLHIYFWQVMRLENGDRAQEAGWMIARVAPRDTQLAIIHPAWLAY